MINFINKQVMFRYDELPCHNLKAEIPSLLAGVLQAWNADSAGLEIATHYTPNMRMQSIESGNTLAFHGHGLS